MTTFYTVNTVPLEIILVRREIFSTGGVYSVGETDAGQLGNGLGAAGAGVSSPVQTLLTGTNWRYISAGGYSAGGLKDNGELWVWGFNPDGKLGTGNAANTSSPVQLGTSTQWKDISFGYRYSTLLKSDGSLWSTGNNAVGQVGDGSITNRSSPVQIGLLKDWKAISSGWNTSAAIRDNGTLWMWGSGAYGIRGSSSTTNISSPQTTVAGGTDWKYVETSERHTLAIKTDGTLWSWGNGTEGALGHANATSLSSPAKVGTATTWRIATCGGYGSSFGIKTDGTLWAWGENADGRLGLGDTVDRSSPTQVGLGTDWKYISASKFHGRHAAAIKTYGTLWTWGNNYVGVLGDGTTVAKSSPVQIILSGWAGPWKSVNANMTGISMIKNDY
jgi:alpha-tubulin suppressor-like RCC1 family protein